MDFGTILKFVLIAALIIAGYYVVSQTAKIKRREGFESSDSSGISSADIPSVTADKSSELVTKGTANMIGLMQLSNSRKSYEKLVTAMDGWTQAKGMSSLNALAAQMIADSKDQASMNSPPSDKTVALMNAINTMTTFHTTTIPAVMNSIDHS